MQGVEKYMRTLWGIQVNMRRSFCSAQLMESFQQLSRQDALLHVASTVLQGNESIFTEDSRLADAAKQITVGLFVAGGCAQQRE